MDAIKALYTDPKKGFVGQTKLVHKLGATQKKGDMRKFYANADMLQMNRKVRKPEHYLRITGPPNSFQIDIMYLQGAFDLPKKYGKRLLLVLIDVLSRKAYIYPMQNNKLKTVIETYAGFLDDMAIEKKTVASVTGDYEFAPAAFKLFNDKHQIHVFTSVAKFDHNTYGDRLGIINRFTRTFKNMLRMYVNVTSDVRYIDQIKTLTDNYNETVHSSLTLAIGAKHTPSEVFESDDLLRKVRLANARHNRAVSLGARFLPIGTAVRSAELKTLFAKEKYHFSQDIYFVHAHDYNRFLLCGNPSKDPVDHVACYGIMKPSRRRFKPSELLPVDPDKVIPIGTGGGEKIAAARKQQAVQRRLILGEHLDEPAAAAAAAAPQGVQTRSRASAPPAPCTCRCALCFTKFSTCGDCSTVVDGFDWYCERCRTKPGYDDQPCVVCGSVAIPAALGPMILCDNCDRGFHKNCLKMKERLPKTWLCPDCTKLPKAAGKRVVLRILMQKPSPTGGDPEYLIEWADSPDEPAVWVQPKAVEGSLALKEFSKNPVEEYDVERIEKRRPKKKNAKNDRDFEYLVKWKDYPASSNTWEPHANIEDTEAFATFKLNPVTEYDVERIVKRRPIVNNARGAGDFEYLVKWKDYPASENTWEQHAGIKKTDAFAAFMRQPVEEAAPRSRRAAR